MKRQTGAAGALARALLNSVDKGLGATRRVTDASRHAGSYSALMLAPHGWVEGHLVARDASLLFTPLGHPIGDRTVHATAASLSLDRRLRLHLFGEWGLSMCRTGELMSTTSTATVDRSPSGARKQ